MYKYGNSVLTYQVFDDGYDIFRDGNLWLTQREPYIPNRNKSYEENAIAQIEELISSYDYSFSFEEDINSMLVEHEYRITLIELGV